MHYNIKHEDTQLNENCYVEYSYIAFLSEFHSLWWQGTIKIFKTEYEQNNQIRKLDQQINFVFTQLNY